jgi:hypothetical protein
MPPNKTEQEANATPGHVASTDQLGLLPLSPHDHPEPQTMVWSALEMQAISRYAAACVAAERERCAKVCEAGIQNAQDWDSSYWDQACESRAVAIRMA